MLFEFLLIGVILIVLGGIGFAYDGSRDVFHPLMFLGPMLIFLYAWMPIRLHEIHGLEGFFQYDQLVFVQSLNFLGTAGLVLGCLSAGVSMPRSSAPTPPLHRRAVKRLMVGGVILGGIGLVAWLASIVNVGGFGNAFGRAYSGGWDDSGYVRDAAMLMFSAFLLILAASQPRLRPFRMLLLAVFITPWLIQAFFTARRGPTFIICTIIVFGWYLFKNKRPPIVAMSFGGIALGYAVLFLVANRHSIYLGSDFDFKTDVGEIVETPDAGNEFIYGAGAILSAQQRGNFYWGKRYLAQILVRPIPRAVWPNKYSDFGVPELEYNAGTGEGFADALGWEGADGSAPGLIADLWLEFKWFLIPATYAIGWFYGFVWRKARLVGQIWNAQYTVLAALSIYLVMQTIEAVLFRVLILSVPMWLVWGKRQRWYVVLRPLRLPVNDGSAGPVIKTSLVH
jgi:hypothetical protein